MSSFLRRRTVALAMAAAATVAALPAQAVRYEGQDFPDSLSLGGSTLTLNGTGKRQVAIYPLYLAALYLP